MVKVIGEIPARYGSKRVKNKNLKDLDGKPLIRYAIDAARGSEVLDDVYVNTESEEIGKIAIEGRVKFFHRDKSLASDHTTSDEFNYDFIKKTGADVLVMINPVSPLIETKDINDAVKYFFDNEYDTVISIRNEQLQAFCEESPVNFNPEGRLPRTQDIPPIQLCAWSICIWRAETFIKSYEEKGYAVFSGKIGLYPIDKFKSVKISTEDDFTMAEIILKSRKKEQGNLSVENRDIMKNIKWEEHGCYLCGRDTDLEPLELRGKPLVDGQFGYAVHPVICRECGFVFLSPRWSKEDYDKFYRNYYDEMYRLEVKPDYGIDGVVKNMEEIWGRIENKINREAIEKIVDAGCGSGYGLKYLKTKMPSAEIFGIESSPECCDFLQSEEIGATLITDDMDSEWTREYEGKMDLMLMRYSVEHMLDPVKTLSSVAKVLSDDGYIYLAVPDMMNPRLKLRDYDNWWEYYFRPVHVYYFSKETLFKTLDMAGLEVSGFGEEKEEIWCLARKSSTPSGASEDRNVYDEQMKVLKRHLP